MSIPEQIKEKWLLYKLATEKDTEAFGELYDLYASKIYRFIYFKVSSASDAEDLTAEVFLKTWEYINGGKEVKHFAGLLYRIARNQVIDFYRHKNSQKEEPLEETLLENFSDAGALVKELEKSNELQGLIKNLQRLKDEYREVVTLRFIDELSFGEIAEILQKSQINVRVLLHRALKTLKKIAEQNQTTT